MKDNPGLESSIEGLQKLYDEDYYKHGCGPLPYERSAHWINAFGVIADEIIRSLHPRRVFDAGCAMGFLVEAFWDRGVECYGSDLSPYAISHVRRDMQAYCRVDSITSPIEGRYDLITCIEVLEHIPPAEAAIAVKNLCSATDTILFSSTPSDVQEPTHCNVRPTIYWLQLFSEFDFWPCLLYDAGFVSPHATVFRKGAHPSQRDVLVLFSELLRYKAANLDKVNTIRTMAEERGRLTQAVEKLTADLNSVEAQRAGAQLQFDQVLVVEGELRQALADAQATHADLLSQLFEAQSLVQQKAESERDLQQRLAIEREAVADAHETHADLLSQLSEAQSLAQQKAESERNLQQQLTIERKSLAVAEDVRADLLGQLSDAQSLAQQMTKSQRNLQQLLLASDTTATELQSRLSDQTVKRNSFECEMGSITDRVTDLREENARLRGLNLALYQERNELQQDLQSILESPGWKLIDQYRQWRWRQQKARPALFRNYERLARWLLHRGSGPISSIQAKSSPDLMPATAPLTAPTAERPKLFSTAKDPGYQRWINENEPDCEGLRRQRELSIAWSHRPLFSIILPVYRVSGSILEQCIQSVCDQSYDHWELCICYAYPEDQANRELLSKFSASDPRIRMTVLESNGGISRNSNTALEMAQGEYVIFLDHDDALAPSALYETATLLEQKPDTDLIYSDHDYIDESGSIRFQPLFKPAWSPEIMLSAAYITHLTIIRRQVVVEAHGFDPATDGAQDWDLFLRVVERTERIEHIPKVLYHWRVHPASTALNDAAKDYVNDAQLLALSGHMERIGLPASPERTTDGELHVRWKHNTQPLVSIVIPTRDKVDLLSKCISSILEKTDYARYEILIIDTGSREHATREYYDTLIGNTQIRLLDYAGTFNYSAVNNVGARHAHGDLFLFLNNDTEVIHPNWLNELVGWAQYDAIGIVGGRLLRPEGTIQHAGVVLGLGGFADHPFADLPPLTYGMYGSTGWYRNYLAVTGACMMMRRGVFEELGGFDESFVLCGSDVEIGLRAWDRGYRVVYNPFAELIHHERQTRKTEIPPEDFITSYRHYGKYLAHGDPYWNPNLSVWNRQIGFRYKDEQSSLQFVQAHLEQVELSRIPAVPARDLPRAIAHKSAPSEAELLVGWFDFSEEEARAWKQQAASVSGPRKIGTIVWFIPPFVNAFYGGIFTILRFARQWQRTNGVRNIFAICGSVDVTLMLQRIKEVLPECKKSDIYVLPGINDVRDLPQTDASISTLWTTAYFALRYRKTLRKFYFIQDYEPAFFSAGSASALVESTYRLGFYGITNTISLKRFYEEEFGGKAIHFTPCVDRKLFFPMGQKDHPPADRPWQVFCYARPSHGRNAFELLAAALRSLKSRLGGKVRIVTAGEDWRTIDHDLEGVVENLGVLPYAETARLYRETDIGVALMFTRHPSYIPMELMASGCLVVTNRNHWTEWLLKHEENCLLSYATATSLADTIERGLNDRKLREEITRRALDLVQERYTDWGPEIEKVYEFLSNPEPERVAGESTQVGMSQSFRTTTSAQ